MLACKDTNGSETPAAKIDEVFQDVSVWQHQEWQYKGILLKLFAHATPFCTPTFYTLHVHGDVLCDTNTKENKT